MVFTKSRTDVLFVYAAYSLRYVYLLLLIPFYARVLGVEGYGVVLAALSLMQMAWVFTNWGFGTVGNREMATAKDVDYPRIFGKHISARLVLSMVAFILGLIAIYYSKILYTHFWAGLFGLLLGILSSYNLAWYFSGSERPRQSVKLEVLGFAISLVLILGFVRKPDDSMLAIGALLISGIISSLAGFWLIKNEVIGYEINLKHGLQFVASTKSMFVLSSAPLLLSASSTYLFSILANQHDVGLFGAAERLVTAGLGLVSPLGAVFVPKVTKLYKQDVFQAYQLVKKIFLVLVLIAVAGSCVSYFFADVVILMIFGKAFLGSVPILKCFAFVFPIAVVTTLLASYVLVPQHHERWLAKVVIVSSIFNVVLAFPLVSLFGGTGMAFALVLTRLVVMLILIFYCYKLGVLRAAFMKKN